MSRSREYFTGVLVFEEWEMKWMEQALALKITTERNKLDFLTNTVDVAEDVDWHQAQIGVQREILAAHELLLQKIKEC